ncbi:MAG: ATP-binding protein [Deltaproteobacteria bacterium HGW-Deltaproteobacteria-15]|nr:MAG: ATP-binding protein [Deltaproteobacteria bacterium HGW-Deltaproteobacteria-15]
MVGVFFLHPVTMAIYLLEFQGEQIAAAGLPAVIGHHMAIAFTPKMLPMTAIFWIIGGLLGLGWGFYAQALARQIQLVSSLEKELGKTVPSLIESGEGATVEFKSSVRWDYELNRVNRELEPAFTKTVAGFLNHEGGNLLIGVSDDGAVVGLERDYATLRRKDRDGFEQLLMRIVKDRLGADVCPLVHVLFHTIDGKDVCLVVVEGSHRPVYLQHDHEPRYYLRIGNATAELNVKEALEHIRLRWPRH